VLSTTPGTLRALAVSLARERYIYDQQNQRDRLYRAAQVGDGGAVLGYVIQGIGYGFAAAVEPGPFQTYLIAQTLSKGWRRALPAALAPLVSDGPIVALVLLVLSQVPETFQRVLYVAGGLFILYLARNAFLTWRDFEVAPPVGAQSGQQSLLKAAMMNALSPGPYMYWSLVTGPILLAGWREAPTNGIGLLFGTARQLGPRVTRALLGISVIALVCFGLYQLWLGISGCPDLTGFTTHFSAQVCPWSGRASSK
jgi:threonine/homoserine/homoserine lactone efflux protein